MRAAPGTFPIGEPEGWPGLVWGADIVAGRARPPGGDAATNPLPPPGGFRWLHVSLADQRARRWLAAFAPLSPAARELLLADDSHQQALVEDDGTIACVLHDFGRDFDTASPEAATPLRFALTPDLIVTARLHPIRCADILRQRIEGDTGPADAAAALEMLLTAMIGVAAGVAADLVEAMQSAEDALLADVVEPDRRLIGGLRRRTVQVHRQVGGLHAVLRRLDRDDALPAALRPPVERLVQRVAALDGDVVALEGQARLLREELEMMNARRTNQNLYILSIITALMLPATLVTGLFGMNTGGLPFADQRTGTLLAAMLAAASALGVYMLLRTMGFFRGGGR